MISRRQLLYYSALLTLYLPILNLKCFAVEEDKTGENRYPLTQDLLKKAYWAEMTANKRYNEYCQKALYDDYPNIAYLFHSLSVSEKNHAENYQKLIVSLGANLGLKEIPVQVADTKTNLNIAATEELKKIKEFYPEILERLSSESHDQAIVNCMYSWKSHQQHKEIISDIKKYSGFFFKSLAKKIERLNPNYYVCEICGSTVDEKPSIPCEICNHPLYHYKKIERPISLSN